MSSSGSPRRNSTAGPSPVSVWAFEETLNIRPYPPVAYRTALARNTWISPVASSYATTPAHAPSTISWSST